MGKKRLRPTRIRDFKMKKTLFAFLAVALCLNGAIFVSCKDSNKGTETEVETVVETDTTVTEAEAEAEQAPLGTQDLTDDTDFIVEGDGDPIDEEGFNPKLELEVIGHPKYGKVIFLEKLNEAEGGFEAKGMLFDKSGNLVETLYGATEFSGSGPIYSLEGKESVSYETIMGTVSFSIGEKEYNFKEIKWY